MKGTTTRLLLIAVAVILVGGLLFFALYRDSSPSFLLVQHAESGTFEQATTGDPDEYILTLEETWPQTIYFSDRPERISGAIDNETFLGLDQMFSPANPPNAAVVLSDPVSDDQDVIIVELLNPQFDETTGTLTYTVRPIRRAPTAGIRNWRPRGDESLPSAFANVSLFIDDPTSIAWSTKNGGYAPGNSH